MTTNACLKYKQTFTSNLDVIGEPVISKSKSKPYTKITFKPDYKRLGIETITPDIIQLFKKRVYDIAAVTEKSVKVSWNSTPVPVKEFQDYIGLYIGKNERAHEQQNERWGMLSHLQTRENTIKYLS